MPETLGQAGILIDSKRPSLAAAAVHRVRGDGSLAEHLAEEGHQRLDAFGVAATRARFIEVVGGLEADRAVSA